MAYTKNKTTYDVLPVENADGTLAGLRIKQERRVERWADNGRLLDAGYAGQFTMAEMEIPLSKAVDLMAEMGGWMQYFASGEAARERASS